MKVSRKFRKEGVPYRYELGKSEFFEGTMPFEAAERIATGGKPKGDEIVNGKYRFQKSCFEDSPKGDGRMNKGDLLATAKSRMTNEELKEAVDKASESPERPHITKNTSTER